MTFYDASTALFWKIVWCIKFILNSTTVQLACKYMYGKRDVWINFIHGNQNLSQLNLTIQSYASNLTCF